MYPKPAKGPQTALRTLRIVFAFTLPLITSATLLAESEAEITAVKFVGTYCVDCHQGEDAEGGLRLDGFESSLNLDTSLEVWKKVVERTENFSMPPREADVPEEVARSAFLDSVRASILKAICEDGAQPGPPQLRRLNRTEYANTVRDLLGIHVNAGHALPSDGAGGEGFDNASETLFISPIYAEKYIDAAREALSHAFNDPGSRRRIVVSEPNAERSPKDAARAVLEKFLPRAFRRGVEEVEVNEYVSVFEMAFETDESYDAAIQVTLQAAMVSPKFLMLYETPNLTGEQAPVGQYEMASRLSYFLWASMPDDELLKLAREERLQDPDVLKTQVERMLESRLSDDGLRRNAKVREFAESFMEQWLGTRALGREFIPDPKVARRYNSELEGGMKYEPVFFFEDILAENLSLLNFIDSDFTYLNRALASHYRIKGDFREQPRRTDLEPDHHRGGLLGMGAVLAVSSHPYRTSPVLRGKWILETILGTPPPPPPPDVPALEENDSSNVPSSLREQLELHRDNATCASCHDMIDPLGFGLENYDLLGGWRDEAGGQPIDTRGELPGGQTFDGHEELKALLMERKDKFVRHFVSKVLGYALSRGLTEEDNCVVEEITQNLAQDDYRSQTLIKEIVLSVPFRYKRGSE
ncbi:DUF1592 domain-containing protein [Rhodopirellula sp. MGV]|uniref:DUF1592 domain-containing protein n=1 Tax=Rhodopirellula sp. MGV TaxID=2023130 RepID=UPI000B9645FC|nr:DUF1592 domain-containing protein [Rhodopirellula sp. MGV]OYP36803.1 hypothetical protein CGZ80_07085 [Rhodopirellula sp. MGV]PNY36488.1 DUF1592 domain-containing protein [Rhodopirellula baltica]